MSRYYDKIVSSFVRCLNMSEHSDSKKGLVIFLRVLVVFVVLALIFIFALIFFGLMNKTSKKAEDKKDNASEAEKPARTVRTPEQIEAVDCHTAAFVANPDPYVAVNQVDVQFSGPYAIGLAAFGVMALIAVLVGIIAAVSTVSGIDTRDNDGD